jgi:hypothetical protein
MYLLACRGTLVEKGTHGLVMFLGMVGEGLKAG